MRPQVVFALYRPHQGRETELQGLLAQHIPLLRELELVTARPPVLARSLNGTYIEIFEWASAEAASRAEKHPRVARLWESIAHVADLPALSTIDEFQSAFPHFEPVTL